MTSELSIAHRVSLPAPKTHLVHVETRIAGPLPRAPVLFMAVWTPGSYLVREYARHIEELRVEAPARATKVRKNAWRVEGHDSEAIVVRYRVYANELTVRTSHVDESHAFLVGAALFLALEGHEHLGAHIEFDVPWDWRIFTSLNASGTGFEAADFDTLVDSTIEIGTHREERVEVLDKPHRFAFWPARAVSDTDVRRLVDDTQTILREEAKLFGAEQSSRAMRTPQAC